MSTERTEKPTPKRRREAREKGQVVQSREISSAVTLLAAFLALKAFAPRIWNECAGVLIRYLGRMVGSDGLYTVNNIHAFFLGLLRDLIWICGPVALLILVTGLLINLAQVGFLFNTGTLMKWNRLNPLEGFRRIFSIRSFAEFMKTVFKVSIIAYVVYSKGAVRFGQIPTLMAYDIGESIRYIAESIMDLAFTIAGIMIVLGIADYLYQWWQHEKALRMTKHELKEEYKQTEGDPLIKGKIKEKQRQLGMQRMMQQIPEADVIITNPTHYAVALKYDEKNFNAPVVVAKGQGYVALKVIEIGREHCIHIVQNKVLARTLYRTTEIGEEIPFELYQAVAEILAYVYSLRER
ncbi:MAG: flagellar biosynthesis protein FlhB [Clostridia bacterium]